MLLSSFITADKMEKLNPEYSRVLAARNKNGLILKSRMSSVGTEMRATGCGGAKHTYIDAGIQKPGFCSIIYKRIRITRFLIVPCEFHIPNMVNASKIRILVSMET